MDAVRCDQALVQEPELVEQPGRGQSAARLHGFDLERQLAEMGVDVAAVAVGQPRDFAQKVVGAGVRRVRCPIAADAAAVVAVPAFDQIGILAQARLADGAAVVITAGGKCCRIGIVDTPGDDRTQPEIGGRTGAGPGIAIVVDNGGAARAQQLVHSEARQREGVVLGEPVPLRDAGRVHRREADVLDHAAGDHQRGMVVDVDQARHHDSVLAIDGRGRHPAGTELVRRADVDDRAVGDGDGASLKCPAPRIQRQDEIPGDQQVARTGFEPHA